LFEVLNPPLPHPLQFATQETGNGVWVCGPRDLFFPCPPPPPFHRESYREGDPESSSNLETEKESLLADGEGGRSVKGAKSYNGEKA
jgi:hypothetical protein